MLYFFFTYSLCPFSVVPPHPIIIVLRTSRVQRRPINGATRKAQPMRHADYWLRSKLLTPWLLPSCPPASVLTFTSRSTSPQRPRAEQRGPQVMIAIFGVEVDTFDWLIRALVDPRARGVRVVKSQTSVLGQVFLSATTSGARATVESFTMMAQPSLWIHYQP